MNDLPEDHLLLETSLNQLIQKTDSGFDSDRRLNATDTVSVVDVSLLPQKGKLMAKAKIRGSENKAYDTYIQFQGIVYNPPESQDRVTFVSNEQTYAISPIDVGNNNVKVRCTCLDFRFRFAMINSADGSLYGPRPPIYRPVPGSNRGSANPSKVPGICKHIKTLMDELSSGGLFDTAAKQQPQQAEQEPTIAADTAVETPPENNSENNSKLA